MTFKVLTETLWMMALHSFRTFVHCSLQDYHRVGYHKFCANWVPKMLTGAHKTQRMASALSFFRLIPQRWQWISQLHCTNNRWWNLGFICDCWNQRAVKAVDPHAFTKQAEKVWTNVCHKAEGNCFLGQERSAGVCVCACVRACVQLATCFCLFGLLLNPEGGGHMLLWNVGLSPDYTALQPERPYS
jgi:hypothetical protein